MAQSTEFPEYRWVEPASWSAGRPYGRPLWIVIHTTEGSERATSAEDGAAYDARRTDSTSTHFFSDQNSTVQCVRTTDRAHAARTNGNRLGIQIEICGLAGQSPAQWRDAASNGTIEQAAQLAAKLVRKWDIDVQHLTVAQVAGRNRTGFCGHVDITRAFPQDGGTHTDPGVNFPWSRFLDRVREILAPVAPPPEDDVALTDTDVAKVVEGLRKALVNDDAGYGFQARRVSWAYPAGADGEMAIQVFQEMDARQKRIEAMLVKLTEEPPEGRVTLA